MLPANRHVKWPRQRRAPTGQRRKQLLLQKVVTHGLNGERRRHFAGFVAPHAVRQQHESVLRQLVLARFDGVQQREGVLVAAAGHAGRRPGGDVQPGRAERAAAILQNTHQFGEASRVFAGRFLGREALGRLARKRFAYQSREQRVHVGERGDDRLGHALLAFKVHLGQLAAQVQRV